jgi:hypothetical protein
MASSTVKLEPIMSTAILSATITNPDAHGMTPSHLVTVFMLITHVPLSALERLTF